VDNKHTDSIGKYSKQQQKTHDNKKSTTTIPFLLKKKKQINKCLILLEFKILSSSPSEIFCQLSIHFYCS